MAYNIIVMKFFTTLITILTATIAFSQQYNLSTPYGQSLLNIDENKNVHLLNSKMSYDLGFMSYQMNYTPALTSHQIGLSLYGTKMNINQDTVFKNHWNETMTTKHGYEFLSQNLTYRSYDKYNEFGIKFNKFTYQNFSENKKQEHDFLYTDKHTTFAFQRLLNNQHKEDNLVLTDKNMSVAFKETLDGQRKENDYVIKDKNWTLTDSDYYNSYHKNFLNFTSKDLNFKTANDSGVSINTLDYKGTTVGYGQGESFIHSKFQNVEYKLSYSPAGTDYEFKYRNIGFRDNQLLISWTPLRFLNVQTLNRKVTNVDYNFKRKDQTLTLKYNNQFDIYDFYFNQNAFSVYDNKYKLIGNSKSKYKEAMNALYSDNKYSFKTDIINNMYSVSFKMSKTLTANYIKDQTKREMCLGYSSGLGTIGLGYNLLNHKVDTLNAKLSFKF